MNRIFGTSNAKPTPSLQDAIASTDARTAAIEVKVKKLDAELQGHKDKMAKMKAGPGKNAVQQRALQVLKQKKMYEAQIAQLTQQAFNMESTALTTENLRNTMATVEAMRTANKELKRQYGKIDVDRIDALHDEMEDLMERANEIQETMGRSYAVPDDLDEEALQAELDALSDMDENELSYLDDIKAQPDFLDEAPHVPSNELPARAEATRAAV